MPIIKYVLQGDMDVSPIELIFREEEYPTMLKKACSWLRDPFIFNVRLHKITLTDGGSFYNAELIKTKHI